MDELYKQLQELANLTEDEWNNLSCRLNKKEFDAKTTLIKEGSIAKNIYFVKSGLLRAFHLQDGKEVNTYLACDKQFISTFSSFITQTASFESLEAIEDSIVYELSYQTLTELYETSSNFEKLGRILAEQNYLCIIDRTIMMQTKSAKQKYLDFMKNYDSKIVQRTPQYQIASFLGITPEVLSRVRKEISIS